MDAKRFDWLVRSLTEVRTRRGLLGLLTALPLSSVLAAFLSDDEAAAKGRRKRRKKPHHHRKHTGSRAGKKKRNQCRPDSRAKTCAGKCGPVKDNCTKTVDCGFCQCDSPCPACKVCDEGVGACIADPAQRGDACGEPGQICQTEGACACDAASCAPCEVCRGDGLCSANPSCVPCSESNPCPGGQLCCAGSCVAGVCCEASTCEPAGNACVDHQCRCGAGDACAGSATACCDVPGQCVDTRTDADNCGRCGHACGSDERCWNGECVCGDVCDSGCQFSSVQAAIDDLGDGSTIRVCAGTYGPITVNKNLTLLGAGDGADPTANTILDGREAIPIMVFIGNGVEVILRGLRITGADNDPDGGGGGIIHLAASLRMNDCTVPGTVLATEAASSTAASQRWR